MPLSKQAREDLKAAYRKDCGKELTDDEAEEMGSRLLRLFRVLLRPSPGDPVRPESQPDQR